MTEELLTGTTLQEIWTDKPCVFLVVEVDQNYGGIVLQDLDGKLVYATTHPENLFRLAQGVATAVERTDDGMLMLRRVDDADF